MRDLINDLIEASGPERLTVTPHTCPHGWEQVKVKKGGRYMFTCKRPSALSVAKQGGDPLTMAWESIKMGRWSRAVESLSLALSGSKGRERKWLQEISSIVSHEADGGGIGKRAVESAVKPLFKKMGVQVTGSSKRR